MDARKDGKKEEEKVKENKVENVIAQRYFHYTEAKELVSNW